MSKHTPGPWKFQAILTASENDRGWNIYRDHAGFGGYVGTVSPRIKGERGDASAEGLANARLIAAAPLLYEALQALYDEQQGPPLIRHHAAWEAAMEKARAAIKAVEEQT